MSLDCLYILQLAVHPHNEKLIEHTLKILENKQETEVFGNTEGGIYHKSKLKQLSSGNLKYSENRKQIQKTLGLKKQLEFAAGV